MYVYWETGFLLRNYCEGIANLQTNDASSVDSGRGAARKHRAARENAKEQKSCVKGVSSK